MKDLNYFAKIFVATQPTDFRKQATGLSQVVEGFLELKPLLDRCLFVFTNKRGKAVGCFAHMRRKFDSASLRKMARRPPTHLLWKH